MKKTLVSMLENSPEEESEDFSLDEAKMSILTANENDLVEKVLQQVRDSNVAVDRHEFRRKGDHLYYRLRISTNNSPKVLVYQIDWMCP